MRPALLDRTRSCGQKPRRVLACERDAPIEGSGYRVVASHSRLKPFGSGDADWVSGQVRAAPCAFRPPAGSEGRCQSQIMTNPRSTQRISEIASSAPSKCHEVSENEACEVLVSFFCPISSSCGDLIGPNRLAQKIAGKRSPMIVRRRGSGARAFGTAEAPVSLTNVRASTHPTPRKETTARHPFSAHRLAR